MLTEQFSLLESNHVPGFLGTILGWLPYRRHARSGGVARFSAKAETFLRRLGPLANHCCVQRSDWATGATLCPRICRISRTPNVRGTEHETETGARTGFSLHVQTPQ